MFRIVVYLAAIFVLFAEGCIKTNGANGSAAFNIVNAINYNGSIVTNFTPLNGKGIPVAPLQYYGSANSVSFGSAFESGSYLGATYLSVSQLADTTVMLWSGEFNLQQGSIHTLFFCGDTTAIDTLMTTDLIPNYSYSDSVAGVRLVNLVKGSLPMSVNLQGNSPTQIEFSNLGYKQISGFKTYSASSETPGNYYFEIRDQASDSLLTVFTWNFQLEKNNTIFIMGTQSLGISAAQMNNY